MPRECRQTLVPRNHHPIREDQLTRTQKQLEKTLATYPEAAVRLTADVARDTLTIVATEPSKSKATRRLEDALKTLGVLKPGKLVGPLYDELSFIWKSLENPVQIIYSVHGTLQQTDRYEAAVRWAVEQWYARLNDVEPDRPVAVWIELGPPHGLIVEKFPEQLAVFYPRLSIEQWREHVMQYPDSPKASSIDRVVEDITNQVDPVDWFLTVSAGKLWEREFRIAGRRFKVGGASKDASKMTPLMRRLGKEIHVLKSRGRSITVYFERPTADSFLSYVQATMCPDMIPAVWQKGDKETGLSLAHIELMLLANNIRRRDLLLAQTIAREVHRRPNALHLVFRGRAHAAEFSRQLEAVDMPFHTDVEPGDRPALYARFLEAGQPSLETPEGRSLALENFFTQYLDNLLDQLKMPDVSVGFHECCLLLSALPKEWLQEWFDVLPNNTDLTTLASLNTAWQWLIQREERLSQLPPDAQGVYRAMKSAIERALPPDGPPGGGGPRPPTTPTNPTPEAGASVDTATIERAADSATAASGHL